jgi:hypothetical protein
MKKIFDIRNLQGLTVLLLVSGLAASCKKLIEIPPNPPTEITQTEVFADSADAVSAVDGIYSNFQVANGGLTIASGTVTMCGGLSADELNTATTNTSMYQYYTYSVLSTNGYVQNFWNAYTNIYQMNACLQGVSGDSSAISASLRQQLTGEIKVARALYYFNLVNLFGDVPLVTGTNYMVNAQIARTPVDSVYGQILSDLTSAMQLLIPAYPSDGRMRPNLYTAAALLAKVELYQQQWQAAANAASVVINSGVYGLLQNLDSVFLDGSNEAIWQLPARGTFEPVSEATNFVPYANSVQPNYWLTPFLLNAFEPGDLRRVAWLDSNVVNGHVYYYPYKYKNTTLAETPVEDYMIFRLADQYLIRAEALAQQNKLDSALSDLNVIRARAGLAPKTSVSQSDLLADIMQERRIEDFCEWGNRWYDLKRTGAAASTLSSEKTGWQTGAALYPLPISQLQNNSLLTQNPGY